MKSQMEWKFDIHCLSRRQVLFVNKFVQNVQNNSFCRFYVILPANKGKICRRHFARQLEFINQNGWVTMHSVVLLVSIMISMNKHQ